MESVPRIAILMIVSGLAGGLWTLASFLVGLSLGHRIKQGLSPNVFEAARQTVSTSSPVNQIEEVLATEGEEIDEEDKVRL